jgi:hypothetical protein
MERVAIRALAAQARNDPRIDDANAVTLSQESVFMPARRSSDCGFPSRRNAGPNAGVEQSPRLNDAFTKKIRREIIERIAAQVVVVLVLPPESPDRQQSSRTQNVRPGGRDIEGLICER